MKDQKDEKLNELFKSYIEGEPLPRQTVTEEALEVLRSPKSAECETVTERQLAAETVAVGSSVGKKSDSKFIYLAVCAVLVIFAAAIFLILSLNRKDDLPVALISDSTEISYDMLIENESDTFANQQFIPFVEDSDVVEYKEYFLKENVENRKDGVVLRNAEFSMENDVAANLFVESEGFYVTELSDYKNVKQSKTIGDNVFYYKIDQSQGKTYIYFRQNSRGYNLDLSVTDKERLFAIMRQIFDSFKHHKSSAYLTDFWAKSDFCPNFVQECVLSTKISQFLF